MPTRLIELDAAADRHVVLAGHDLRRREIDRVEPGRAEAVDLDAGDRVRIVGVDDGGARDVAARLADRIDAAHHHVVDQRRIELVAVADGLEHMGREIERGHLVQRAVRLAAPARGADVIVDECVGHHALLLFRQHGRLSETAPGASRQGRAMPHRPHRLRAITTFMISLVPA